ncbi:hypothetical protein BD324DRAFT_618185 [Kockovaella imperatae]|uniref:Uncharacterized protein n=1 Tax=Kockovaella imperatae TaxID=4999 RepID=A0A1Y1UND7_9TREE|nr:hypothetical protein BD324DRAFT_618185 [Kockovaella imperatae]ORX39004.1 hypothetical protein BD324DRAFT_618185 [Kockovaella imperatae]
MAAGRSTSRSRKIPNGAPPEDKHSAHSNYAKATVDREAGQDYHIAGPHVQLDRSDHALYTVDHHIRQALQAMKHGHTKPFLKAFHHVLEEYKRLDKSRSSSYRERFQKHCSIEVRSKPITKLNPQSNADAPRLRTGRYTTLLWLVKVYAKLFGGLVEIPSCASIMSRGGPRPRMGLTQLCNQLPVFGAPVNTIFAILIYTLIPFYIGLPFGSEVTIYGTRLYAGFWGWLGPLSFFLGAWFKASEIQPELFAAHLIETWIHLLAETEQDELSSDGSYASEGLSRIFFKASQGQVQDVTYPKSFRRAVWGDI